MKFDTNNHSVFKMYYHLILCTKYRRNVIDDHVSQRLMEMFQKIAPDYNISLDRWNHDQDHVDVLFRGQPNTELTKFINAYKSASSRLIKKEFPEIRQKLWKEMFWSRSFCILTTGGATIELIRKYIKSQGAKKKQKPAKCRYKVQAVSNPVPENSLL